MKMKTRIVLPLALLLMVGVVGAAPYPAFYINSFEDPGDTSPPALPSDDVMFGVTRVASGTNGIQAPPSGNPYGPAGTGKTLERMRLYPANSSRAGSRTFATIWS